MRRVTIVILCLLFLAPAFSVFADDMIKFETVWDEYDQRNFKGRAKTLAGYEAKYRIKVKTSQDLKDDYGIPGTMKFRIDVECYIKATTPGGFEKFTTTEKKSDTLSLLLDDEGNGSVSTVIYVPFDDQGGKFQIYSGSCGAEMKVICIDRICK